MLKSSLGVIAFVALISPALGADEYYIVRGPDRQCKVVSEQPTTTVTIVGDEDGYDTREEAEIAMKRICRTNDQDDDDND